MLRPNEQERIEGILSGKYDPNNKTSQRILGKPHVAVAFSAILDLQGLSDEKLAEKISEIINRQPITSKNKNTGAVSTNQTAVDTNTLNAIKAIWQIKGLFVEHKKIEHTGGLADLGEEQLDKIIKSGTEYLFVKKTRLSHEEVQKQESKSSD